jgi:hypothetical protein
VATAAALVLEGGAVGRQELPRVAARRERQRQDPEGVVLLDLGVIRGSLAEAAKADPARADDEGPDAALVVARAVGGSRCEPLVVVIVSREDEVDASCRESAPEGVDVRVVAVLAGAPPRVVEVREGALRRPVLLEIGADPRELLRALVARGSPK